MEAVLLDEVVRTEYGQFDLTWGGPDDFYGFDGDFDKFFDGQVNGLAGASSPHGLYVHFARRAGGSQVRISLLDQAPTCVDPAWEDVVEVSVNVPAGTQPVWASWGDECSGTLALPPGTYRVRVSACGRDAGRKGEFADEVVDFYLIEFWPGPAQPDAILAATSEDAAYWHRKLGSRR